MAPASSHPSMKPVLIPQPQESPPPSASTSTTVTPRATPSPIPPPVPVETHPNRLRADTKPQVELSRFAPQDEYRSPPQPRSLPRLDGNVSSSAAAAAAALRPAVASLRAPPVIPPVAARLEAERRALKAQRRAHKKARIHPFKKLLWVKQQGYPDNYTDPNTFLEHLQRPQVKPYDFWSLVADSCVIVQHVGSLVVFVASYAGIYQDRLNDYWVALWGCLATGCCWIIFDHWLSQEEKTRSEGERDVAGDTTEQSSNDSTDGSVVPVTPRDEAVESRLRKDVPLSLSTSNLAAKNAEHLTVGHVQHASSLSRSSFASISPIDALNDEHNFPSFENSLSLGKDTSLVQSGSATSKCSSVSLPPTFKPPLKLRPVFNNHSSRNSARLKTFKSALLIYFSLLGLSPILKSLTQSTSSDSIWALATWLLIINIFFFDYESQYTPSNSMSNLPHDTPPSPPPTSKTAEPTSIQTQASPITLPPQTTYPSSLSTNAALMASTVLASRLPTPSSVFTLTLFSIQVFGLFPLFRRHLRSKSFTAHVYLTIALVLTASAGLGLILSQSYTHTHGNTGYRMRWIVHVVFRGGIGMVTGAVVTIVAMGGCALWLIELQRYKDVVIGPWDVAKPILKGRGVGVG